MNKELLELFHQRIDLAITNGEKFVNLRTTALQAGVSNRLEIIKTIYHLEGKLNGKVTFISTSGHYLIVINKSLRKTY